MCTAADEEKSVVGIRILATAGRFMHCNEGVTTEAIVPQLQETLKHAMARPGAAAKASVRWETPHRFDHMAS